VGILGRVATLEKAPPLRASRWLVLCVGGFVLVLAVSGVLAVKHFGLVWPYPQILPGAAAVV